MNRGENDVKIFFVSLFDCQHFIGFPLVCFRNYVEKTRLKLDIKKQESFK